ncbi:AraC family transcriptional regulator [Enterococcus sp. 669A]|uniref:AraC family transcriptional regulator n=1 Tax=Candidatus Enterococcus moelleringii TaxID=2815325 RepID=A0ABS3LBJ0_9ENTE|nr:helix-turn-helix domain-containing protein [Enterococcus sp. 669A]MBO1305779.1 AraC family transcriptional regulator [Enterococcus sp. 669A]
MNKQNFSVISTPFQPFISENKAIENYREEMICWNPEILKREGIVYQFTVKDAPCRVMLFPDACVNFLFECTPDAPKSWMSGLCTEPLELSLAANTTYFGIKPFSNIGLKYRNGHASDYVNKTSTVEEVFSLTDDLALMISQAADFEERKKTFFRHTAELIHHERDTLSTECLSILLCDNSEEFSLNRVEQEMGYTKRYSEQLFKTEIGIPPKKYSRVIRFQNCLKELNEMSIAGNLADVAIKLGYYDQAHLIRDFKSFTNYPPMKLVKELRAVSC